MPRLDDIPPGYTADRAALGRSRVVPKGEDTLTAEERQLLIDLVQATADVLGFVDPTPTCDGISMVISLSQGDFFGASLSIISMVPFIGDAAKLGKLPKYRKVLDRAIAQAKKSTRFETLVKPLLIQLQDSLGRLPDFLPEKLAEQVRSMRGSLDGYLAARAAKKLEEFKQAEQLGIPVEHALAIRHAVVNNNPNRYIVFIREAKLEGMEWIRRGYPAKPREIKAGTDKDIGLVVAKTADEINEALAAGHFVVSKGSARNGSMVAEIGDAPEWGHMPDGLIIDKNTMKPFTSDFDVGAIIDPSAPRRNLALLKTGGTGDASVYVKDYIDPRERAMIDSMNQHMGGLNGGGRLKHGPDDKFSNTVREDRHIAFLPDGTMVILEKNQFQDWMDSIKRGSLGLKDFKGGTGDGTGGAAGGRPPQLRIVK